MNLRKLRLRAVWLLVIPFFAFSTPTLWLVLAGVLVAFPGFVIRGWSAGTIHKDKELTTTGPYAHTRNPLYLGSLFIGLGVTIAGGHWIWPLLFLAFFLTVYTRTMRHEEELLTEVFGDRYLEYLAKVPAFLPVLAPAYVGDEQPGFRWSQYRKYREWEAALGGFAAFGLLAAKALFG